MKYLICGDVHWCQYSSILRSRGKLYSTRLENLIKSINWVEDLARENECDGVIYLGDFMDRPDCNAEEITALQDILWYGGQHIFIVGNHESNISNLSYSSANMFESIDAQVISEPYNLKINNKITFTFIPYILPNELKTLSEYIEPSDKNIVFAHEDIAGIQYGKLVSAQGFDIEDINKNCSLFFDGHLHNGGLIGNNIILVGNLTGQNFNENAMLYDHCVYLMDIDENNKITVDKYVNEEALKFYKIKIEKEEDLSLLLQENIKKNAVVSISCNNLFKEKVLNLVNMNNHILDHRLSIYYVDNTNLDEEKENFEVEDHFKQFVAFAKSKLDPSPILDDELSRIKG